CPVLPLAGHRVPRSFPTRRSSELDDTRERRHALISNIAAWAIEHPGVRVEQSPVFATLLRRLRDAVFIERRVAVARLVRDVAILDRKSTRLNSSHVKTSYAVSCLK